MPVSETGGVAGDGSGGGEALLEGRRRREEWWRRREEGWMGRDRNREVERRGMG